MKSVVGMLMLCLVAAGVVMAQSQINIVVNSSNPSLTIPHDFLGLSFESGSVRSNNAGVLGNFFDTNTSRSPKCDQSLTIFRNLGIRNLRIGGGSVDQNNIIPTNTDIDALFSFVNATGLDVIYSLRLLNGSGTQDASIAKYVWGNYKQYLLCLAIGNEPDWKSYKDVNISGWPSYLTTWRAFADTVVDSVADVIFGGPDTGSNYPVPGATNTEYNNATWTELFADSSVNTSNMKYIFLHNYVGQGAPSIASGISVQQIINSMLSVAWDTAYYPALYNASCVPAANLGYPFRLTESNSFSGYRSGASNSFATALFALDYLHWWAEHGAAGVNFHNKQWVGNGPIYMDGSGNYQVYPVGYGFTAFDIGGHGKVNSVSIFNPDTLNLTSYAVTDTNGRLFVTIINKEHFGGTSFSPAPRDAEVTVTAPGLPDTASVMFLKTPDSNVLDTQGVTLGGSMISNSTSFQGRWSAVDTAEAGRYVLRVPYASAAIVRIGGPFVSIGTPLTVGPKGDTSVPRMSTLNWNRSANAATYDLQISTDPAFHSTVFDTTLTDTAIVLSSPLSATTKYYWHVGGADSLYTSLYSPVDSFTTGTGILSVDNHGSVPYSYSLFQNYPNPFNPTTVIRYQLSAVSDVSLKVYDVLGRKVATLASGRQNPGKYSVTFDASRLPSGVYFYKLGAGSFSAVRKMLLLK